MANATDSRIVNGALPRIEWGPVIAGVLCALATHVVLGLFGAAFGFAAEPADSEGVGVGAGIWALLVPLAASLIGAFIAVRIAGQRDAAGAHLHGAMVWCIGLIAGALFITGSMATGAMTAATGASGNVRGQLAQRDAGPRADARMDEAAKGAAAAAGAGGVGALLGLAGAFLGAGLGRRALTGERLSMRRGAPDRSFRAQEEREREIRGAAGGDRVVHADGTGVVTSTTSGRTEVVRPGEDPGLHQHH